MLFHLIGTITLTLFCIRDTTQNSTCSNPDLNLNVHTDHIIVTFPRSVGPSEVIINLDMHYSRRCVQDTTRITTRISAPSAYALLHIYNGTLLKDTLLIRTHFKGPRV